MRIAYVLSWPAGAEQRAEHGVIRKIEGQTREWSDQGHVVAKFVMSGAPAFSEMSETRFWRVSSLRDQLAASARLARAVKEWRPDVIYLRHGVSYPAFWQLARRNPTILEINSDDATDYARTLPWWKLRLHAYARSRMLSQARGFVAVSHEISKKFAVWRKPMLVLANGIDLERHPATPAPANPHPRLLFMGSPDQPWQGVEKIPALARAFPDWTFDVVGSDAPSDSSPPNIAWRGYLSRREYEPLLAAADVAIGTLALYRRNLEEASPLKTREYLAAGLPMIAAYQDSDFIEACDFILRVPNDEHALDIERIRAFVMAWKGKRVPRERIRHLDTQEKETCRLEFMARCRAR